METDWEFILNETDNRYYCVLCDCDVYGIRNTHEHFVGERHARALELHGRHISCSDPNNYYCYLCECNVCGYSNVRRHLMGRRHVGFLTESESSNESSEVESSEGSWQLEAMESSDFCLGYDETWEYTCYLCNVDLEGDWQLRNHLRSWDHVNAFRNNGHNIWKEEDDWHYCSLCKCRLSSLKNLYQHINGNNHKYFART